MKEAAMSDETKPAGRKRGPKPRGETAMSGAERNRLYRQRRRAERLKKAAEPVAAEKSIRLTRLAVATVELLHIIESSRLYDGEPLPPEQAATLREATTRAGLLAIPKATEVDIRRLGEPWGVEQVEFLRRWLAEKERRFAAGESVTLGTTRPKTSAV
jgi:hypothetical protein